MAPLRRELEGDLDSRCADVDSIAFPARARAKHFEYEIAINQRRAQTGEPYQYQLARVPQIAKSATSTGFSNLNLVSAQAEGKLVS